MTSPSLLDLDLPLGLAPHVHAVQLGDDLVMLDLRGGRYLCLSGVAITEAGELQGHEDLLSELQREGLVIAGALERRQPSRASPRRSVEAAKPGARDLLAAARAVADTAGRYRGRPLRSLIDEARRARRGILCPDTKTLELAARFQGFAPYLPVPAKCLLRSFLLLGLLRRAGRDANWVFGVRTWPFAAHCWLQADDVVLDDDWERVAAYAPLLVA